MAYQHRFEDQDFPDSDSDLDEVVVEKAVNPKNLINGDDLHEDFGVRTRTAVELQDNGLFTMEETDSGVQFTAVKPFIGALVAPTNAPPNNPAMPDEDLELEWIYGYRGHDSRDNLAYNSKRQIVYPSASVVVTYDKNTNTQLHFQGHNDDVVCMAHHPINPDIVATGQVATIIDRKATLPYICIHNTVTRESWRIKDAHKRQVRAMAFSADGNWLASVGDDNDQTVCVWNWKTGKLLASEKGDTNKIFHMRWNHTKLNEFVTVGNKHIYFWSFDGQSLKKSRGLLGEFPTSTFPCVGYSEKGYACVGTQEGSIYVFVERTAKKEFKVHDGAVYAVDWYHGGLVSGGKDGYVVVLDKTVAPIDKIPCNGRVKSIAVVGDDLLVGTSHSEIFEIKNFLKLPNNLSPPVVQGHWDGEQWGLAVSPDNKEIVTVGEDNCVFVWDPRQHLRVREGKVCTAAGKRLKTAASGAGSTTLHAPNQCARAVAWSPDGKEIACGTNWGEIVIFDAKTLAIKLTSDLNEHGKRNLQGQAENWIQALNYSPDGRVLAVGTHGMVIVLCDVKDQYKVKGKLTAHNSAISHLDWSKDGRFIQSNCIGYELLFHDVDPNNLQASTQNKYPKKLRDVDWASRTCILGWPVKGVFDPTQDGTDINTIDVNPAGTLIATGDDYGYVNLFRYPANEDGNQHRVKWGHSSHVQLVRWSKDGKYLYSCGGNDKTICQWRLKK